MENEIAFRIATLLLLVAAVSISVSFRHKAEREGGAMERPEGRWLLLVLRLLALFALLPLLAWLINPTWVIWARFPAPDWLRWLAVAAAATMIPALYWMFHSLGLNISPTQATRQGHQLITHGPYRWIRHPLYSFGLIFFLALIVVTCLWSLAVGMLIPFALLMWRTPKEEARLVEKFGDDYRVYMQRTGRFFPRLSS